MKDIKLSIIIPVYNCGKYIQDCLDSILKQDNTNIEILIINDGSTDDSKQIVSTYENKFYNFKYFEQANHGVSYSRNIGINNSKGKYIFFIDADDFITDGAINYLLNLIEGNFFEFATFGYQRSNIENIYNEDFIYVSKEEMINNIHFNPKIAGYLWNKIFLRTIIDKNNIHFNEKIKIREDELFILEYLKSAERCIKSDFILYNYRYNPSSITNSISSKKRINEIISYINIYMCVYDDKFFPLSVKYDIYREMIKGILHKYFKIIFTKYENDFRHIFLKSNKDYRLEMNFLDRLLYSIVYITMKCVGLIKR